MLQANEYGVKPTPKISPEYDYLPVVSYAEAADKARLGPLLAKIREIAGNAATNSKNGSGSCSPRFKWT